mmetsp:Transcript_13722/g.22379  ORF Transcript_13722/g.22379 Transcript_13722/m.22379 type:complete len:177 (+) Transcript_13722:166-696(+)|eukprot:CAMPEP_0203749818 /NCGR_PEP_ID=MMETSP0098-20131031/4224_1 /ASSEMBLY_ACC=CAM_ASM_000208 /TAXON_ID=96639 /ORGANISM=" , Strain NY0313808BC1" /LENGTH=176 /DNA_ID=CAMNT_0050638929 /DNA_START=146 /DNA_END=676 /DNA_ORIENTATION=+
MDVQDRRNLIFAHGLGFKCAQELVLGTGEEFTTSSLEELEPAHGEKRKLEKRKPTQRKSPRGACEPVRLRAGGLSSLNLTRSTLSYLQKLGNLDREIAVGRLFDAFDKLVDFDRERALVICKEIERLLNERSDDNYEFCVSQCVEVLHVDGVARCFLEGDLNSSLIVDCIGERVQF